MATYRTDVATFDTTSGTKTATVTTAVGDWLIALVAHDGNTADHAVTDNQSGTWERVYTGVGGTTSDSFSVWIRRGLVTVAAATIVQTAPGASTGGGLDVIAVAGMVRGGRDGIRQFAVQNTVAATTPAPVFATAPLTDNMVIGFVSNGTNGNAVVQRANFSERQDLGHNVPAAGMESMTRDSGETATTQTWGGASASAFSSIVLEIDASGIPAYYMPTPSKAHPPRRVGFGPPVLITQNIFHDEILHATATPDVVAGTTSIPVPIFTVTAVTTIDTPTFVSDVTLTPGVNMLRSSATFGTDTTADWAAFGTATITRDAAQGNNALGAMKVDAASAFTGAYLTIPTVTRDEGYVVSAYVKTTTVTKMVIGICKSDGSFAATGGDTTVVPGVWTRLEQSLTNSSVTRRTVVPLILVGSGAGSGDIFYVDDVQFEYKSGTPATTWTETTAVPCATTIDTPGVTTSSPNALATPFDVLACTTTIPQPVTLQYPATVAAVTTIPQANPSQFVATVAGSTTIGQPVTPQSPNTVAVVTTIPQPSILIPAVTVSGSTTIDQPVTLQYPATVAAVTTIPQPSILINGVTVAGTTTIPQANPSQFVATVAGTATINSLANGLTTNQAGIETDASGWTQNFNPGSLSYTLAQGTDQFHSGAASLKTSWSTGTGASQFNISIPTFTQFPVQSGEQVEFRIWVRSNVARTVTANIDWRTGAAGASYLTSDVQVASLQPNEWVRLGVRGSYRATATFACVTLSLNPVAGDIIWMDDAEFYYSVVIAGSTFTPATVAGTTAIGQPVTPQSPATVAAVTTIPQPSILVPAVTVAAVTTIGQPATPQSPSTVSAVSAVDAPTIHASSTILAAVVAGSTTITQPDLTFVTGVSTVAAVTTIGAPTFTSSATVVAVAVSGVTTVGQPVTPQAPNTVFGVTTIDAPTFTSSATVAAVTVDAVTTIDTPTVVTATNATATVETVAPQSVVEPYAFADDFERSDGDVGNGWVAASTPLEIISGRVTGRNNLQWVPNASTWHGSMVMGEMRGAGNTHIDIALEDGGLIESSNASAELKIDYDEDTDLFRFELRSFTVAQGGNAFNVLDDQPMSVGDLIEWEWDLTQRLSMWQNGVLVLTLDPTNYTSVNVPVFPFALGASNHGFWFYRAFDVESVAIAHGLRDGSDGLIVSGAANATPSTVAVTASIDAPTIQVATNATVSAVTVSAVATVGQPVTPQSPNTVSGTATIDSPTIHASSTILAAVVAGSATITQPDLTFVTGVSTVAAVTTIDAPTVHASSTITPATVAATATVDAPTIHISSAITATTVSAVATITQPATLQYPATVNGSTTIDAPTIHASSTITAATVSATATITQPDLTFVTGVSTVNASTTIGAPTFASSATVAAVTVAGTATVGQPVTIQYVNTVSAVASVDAPTVHASSTLTPATVSAVATVDAPTVQASSTVAAVTVAGTTSTGSGYVQPAQAATVSAVATVGAPSIQTSGNINVAATTVSAVATVGSPTFTSDVSLLLSTVSALTSVGSPTFASSVAVTPNVVAGAASIGSPTETSSSTVTVTTVSGSATVPAPTETAAALVVASTVLGTTQIPVPPPPTGGNTTIGTPVIIAGSTADATTVSAIITIGAPSPSAGAGSLPTTVSAQVTVGAAQLFTGSTVSTQTVGASTTIGTTQIANTALIFLAVVQAVASQDAVTVTTRRTPFRGWGSPIR